MEKWLIHEPKIGFSDQVPHIQWLVLCVGLLFIMLMQPIKSQEWIEYRKRAFTKNFRPFDYKAANQNWSITQSKDGILYFGNSDGLLENNGSIWRLFYMPDSLVIRSVLSAEDGRIYCGAHEEFGYWQPDRFGDLEYVSLSKQIKDKEILRNDDIWDIVVHKGNVFFRSITKLYVYTGDAIRILHNNLIITKLFKFNNKIYFHTNGEGLFTLSDALEAISVSTPGINKSAKIREIFPFNMHSWLIVTEGDGMFIKQNGVFQKWVCQANHYIRNFKINKAVQLKANMWVLSSLGNGILVVDSLGTVCLHLDRRNGLQNNTVLDLMVDDKADIWVSMDKGIDHIEMSSPFSYVEDKAGFLGSVYCASVFERKLFLGTNQGVFVTPWEQKDRMRNIRFVPVSEVKGQVWNLENMDGELICGHNEGSMSVRDGKISSHPKKSAGMCITRSPLDSNAFFQGTYSGIEMFRKNKYNTWAYIKSLNIREPLRYLEFDSKGNLWASHFYQGLFQFRLNQNQDSIIGKKFFNRDNGFHSNKNINVFKIGNKVVFADSKMFYYFDYLENQIKPYKRLNEQLGEYSVSHRISRLAPNEYWFIKKDALGQFLLNGDSLILKNEIFYNQLHKTAVNQYENIWRVGAQEYLIGLDDGFSLIDLNVLPDRIPHRGQVRIYRIESYTSGNEDALLPLNDEQSIKIHHSFNRIRFAFSVPGQYQTMNFFCKLSKDENWTDLGKDHKVYYTNLKPGKYTFHVKAVSQFTGEESFDTYSFDVLSPWYAHIIAFAGYFLIMIFVIYRLRISFVKRLNAQKFRYLKKIREDNKSLLIKLKNKYLSKEVVRKSRELCNYTILVNQKNNILQQLKDKIEEPEISDAHSYSVLKKKLLQMISGNLSDCNELEAFKIHFDDAHEEFLKTLKDMHPQLSPNDLRFCALLRMNMTSKEISNLLNVSIRSIEVKRYRLRKKLNIKHEQNLVEYIMCV